MRRVGRGPGPRYAAPVVTQPRPRTDQTVLGRCPSREGRSRLLRPTPERAPARSSGRGRPPRARAVRSCVGGAVHAVVPERRPWARCRGAQRRLGGIRGPRPTLERLTPTPAQRPRAAPGQRRDHPRPGPGGA
ncbi:hypothetical protein NOCARDAX2BIS_450016 [Nocardioides sp. AX2bis]|nr:hypothetical protein NOCARDAX2BIS_450016 [Nocardioides sp. AX2bis]